MIVVAGEALVDLVGEPDGRYRPVPGGSPANVAVALARLGHDAELLGRLGSGQFGALVRDHLVEGGVGLTYAVQTDQPTTLAIATLDETGQATYDFYVEGTADWGWRPTDLPDQLPDSADALCAGSLAVAIEPGASALRDFIGREYRRGAVTVVLDPNLRPSLLGSRQEAVLLVESLVATAHVVKVSDEDLGWLEPGRAVNTIARRWIELGPALVVVTRGDKGAHALSSSGSEVSTATPPIELVDTVGAGDTFTAAMVDAFAQRGLLGAPARLHDLTDEDLRAVLHHAAAAAAITCSRRGANPPTRDELDQTLRSIALQVSRDGRHTQT